ncbi:RPAP1-like protein [Tirmania nivea]|nr:RPAP1-like protein [Tirmania nivea]
MAFRGERFNLNLDEDADFLGGPSIPSTLTPGGGFIKDIVEKPVSSAPVAPSFPSRTTATGFPEHKKRVPKQSAIRQQRAAQQQQQQNRPPPQLSPADTAPPRPNVGSSSFPEELKTERQQISDENQRRLDAMSPEEIEKERRELLANLNPKLVERLLQRATLDDMSITPSGWNIEGSKLSRPMRGLEEEFKPNPVPKSTREPPNVDDEVDQEIETEEQLGPDERAPRTLPPGQKTLDADPIRVPIHFPAPPAAPELDPASPDFLNQLHEKYYPDLPADPSKLSWMAPVSDVDDATYLPSLPSLPPSAIRFDFKGNILPPRKAREMPTHLGLHHHGDAPGAAGYTIPELSHLARSSFPAQRCMAYQTLGRILYKLGVRAYGEEEALNQGLWKRLHEGRVLDGLEEAASGRGTSHMGIKAYATEALWLWQKGGGQRWKAE